MRPGSPRPSHRKDPGPAYPLRREPTKPARNAYRKWSLRDRRAHNEDTPYRRLAVTFLTSWCLSIMSHNIPPINPNPAEIRTHDISRKRMTRSVLILFLAAAAPVFAADPCDGSRDLRLINGRIVTMDARNTVLSSAAIQNGRFVPDAGKLSPCTKVINLRGRTAVPGLIDNHNHIVLLGIRPGYDTRLETAGSIADVQSLIRERAKTVPAGGFITAMGGWNIAQFAEKRLPTLAELDAAYSDRMGVTTNVDMGAFVIPGTPDTQDAFAFDTLASADPFHMYDAVLALHAEHKMSTRLRLFMLSMDTQKGVPLLKQRLLNAFPNFGDDMMRVSGIGEFATQWPLFGQVTPPPNYLEALQLIAKHGWAFQQHSLSPAEDQLTAGTFEAVNATTPIAGLRWSIAHAPRIDQATLNRFKALGAGIAIHPFEYLAGAPGSGPPVRMILDSGIHAGAGSDSAQISTLDPWLMIYYMVTGKNAAGVLINDKQQITRMEALRLYTAQNGWFFREENLLGSIEPGKLGDLVVLSDDYFDAKKVPDEAIKRLKSVLTVVGGQVVYDDMR